MKKQKNNLRKEAKGRDCQVYIEGHCNNNPETVILAHLNSRAMLGIGMGMKPPDIFGAWCCSDCHDVIDGRSTSGWTDLQILTWFYEGVFRTQNILLKEGKL